MSKPRGPLRGVAAWCRTKILTGQPTCIEFTKPCQSLFVLGTYELDERGSQGATVGTQKRTGSLQLYRLEKNADM